jgi:hypothetical protein
MNKRSLIIKDPKASVVNKESHLEVITLYERQSIGFAQISAVFLNVHMSMDIGVAYVISKKVPVYFIDARGTILSKITGM